MGMLYLCTIVPAGRKASESTSVINYSNNNDYASYSQEKQCRNARWLAALLLLYKYDVNFLLDDDVVALGEGEVVDDDVQAWGL